MPLFLYLISIQFLSKFVISKKYVNEANLQNAF